MDEQTPGPASPDRVRADGGDAGDGVDDARAAELADALAAGDVRLYALEEHTDPATAAAARRRYLADATGADLAPTAAHAFDGAEAESNVENLVGSVQIPLGVAGPVPVDGAAADGEYHLPIATTEGVLVASINRGCATIADAGGATARVHQSAMTRAPVFRVADAAEGQAVAEWVRANEAALADAAEETTSHGELLGVEPHVVGDNVFLRFAYDTKDAMGMNMATIATEAAADVIEAETTASLVAVSGNMCADKKPAAINAVQGRGHTVTADVTIPGDAVEQRLKTTPAAIAEANTRKNLVGSAKAASLGFNAQVANVVAGVFLATGQDAAQVVEGANAITTARERDGDLYASVTLASLEVGTVGGGTGLPAQSAALDVLGLRGGGDPPGENADAFAEVVAAGALAGELSLLAALAARHLGDAHATHGR